MSAIPIRFLINSLSVLGAMFALWKGGRAERLSALIVIANVMFGQMDAFLGPSGDSVLRLVNDGVTALILLAITVRYGALWIGGIAAGIAALIPQHKETVYIAVPAGVKPSSSAK